jgi:hypothetical protein
MTALGPRLTTWALQQVVSYLRNTGRDTRTAMKVFRTIAAPLSARTDYL